MNMLVGDTKRIELHAERGYAIPRQAMPEAVRRAYERLINHGYTTRLVA